MVDKGVWVGFTILLSVCFFACKKQQDKTVPTIYVTSPVGSSSYQAKDTIVTSATLVDNDLLASYSVVLKPEPDENLKADRVLPFFYDSTARQISGNTFFVDYMTIVGDSLSAGDYQFIVNATDAAGNFSSFPIQIKLKSELDSVLPVIDSFTVADSIPVSAGLSYFVALSDDTELAYFVMTLANSSTGDVLVRTFKDLSGTQFSSSIIEPSTIQKGTYRFSIEVRDWVNHAVSTKTNVVFY
jgi:Domain of unknown function (DUF4625)